jgi:hypothetical protein
LRTVNGIRVALDANESVAAPDDDYLNDEDHRALTALYCGLFKLGKSGLAYINLNEEYANEWKAAESQWTKEPDEQT